MSIESIKIAEEDFDGSLLIRGSQDNDWYIASSLNNKLCAEGSWEKWVVLAREILNEDNKRKRPNHRIQKIIF